MKQNSLLAILISLILVSCNKNSEPQNNYLPESINLQIEQNASSKSQVIFKVLNKISEDITQQSKIFINDVQFTSNTYTVSQNTLYVVKIINDNLIVYYNVNFDNDLNFTLQRQGTGFTKKSIAEMYTGTWCGICPGTLIPLENYFTTHPKTLFIAVHGPNGSNDPYTYIYDAQLRTAFNITGVPTVVLNRDIKWANPNDTATLNQLTTGKVTTGISLETTISGSTVNVISKVKFDSTITQPLKLAIALVEDSMAFNQANYGHFGLPNPIVNYCHRNALRKMATDILGDVIPAAATTAGNVYQSIFSINVSGYNLSKCRIIAYVVYGSGTTKKGVVNAQVVTIGQNQDFD